MKNNTNDILFYARLILSKWMTWVTALLDIIALAVLLFYPALHLPPVTPFLITLIGFFWVSFQVYLEKPNSFSTPLVKPRPYDLLPLSFEIWLQSPIPEIRISLYVINYQSKELVFDEIKVIDFTLTGVQRLDTPVLHHNEIRIQPRQSGLVICQRPLIESEVRLIMNAHRSDQYNATLSVATRAHLGRKPLNDNFPSRSISGRISGIPASSEK